MGTEKMAKATEKQAGVNKSAAIRTILEKNPKTPVKEIVTTLDGQGIKVHPNLVYLIKSKSKQKTKRARRQRAVEATAKVGVANPVELILEVRKVAEKAGGIRHLKKLVDLLAE
jgi:hypothetical protein